MKQIKAIYTIAVLSICSAASLHAQVKQESIRRLATGTPLAATTTAVAPVADGIYYIRINQTGKYLGVEGVNTNNGAALIQWDYMNLDNHKFMFRRTNEAGCYTIMAMHSNRYINVEGSDTRDGARIIQWDFADQDNVKWYVVKVADGVVLRNKQSGKDIKLSGAANNANNGVPVLLNGNPGAQVFSLVPVDAVKQTTGGTGASNLLKVQKSDAIQRVASSVNFRLPAGTTVTRYFNLPTNTVAIKKGGDQKKVINETGGSSGECVTQTARIDMGPQENLTPVSASDYLLWNAPGMMYDMITFYAGDYRTKEKFRFGEGRNPIVLTTSVRNIATSITETVQTPTRDNINQAISNLYNRFTNDPNKTGSQSFVYYGCALESTDEFFMKVGAAAKYFGGSVDASMAVGNKQEYKSMYFEATKELFSIDVMPTQQGFFNAAVEGAGAIGYVSQAVYGVKVIGKIEIKNVSNSMEGKLKVAYDAGFAGGSLSIENLSKECKAESRVFLYVVGGTSNSVVSCTLNNIQGTIENITRSVTYHTAMPLRVQFSTLDGQAVKYADVTNNFNYERCVPPALAIVPRKVIVNTNEFRVIGSDCDLYGEVWIELWSPRGGDMNRFRRSPDNRVFKASETQVIKKNELYGYKSNREVLYDNIPPELLEGAEVHIYYMLKDQDDFDDDFLEQRGGHKVQVKNPNGGFDALKTPYWEFYRSEIKLTGADIQGYDTEFVDRGDGVKISFWIKNEPMAPKK